jgi:putative membrane protein
MKNVKQLGWLATGASFLLWSAMCFAQSGGAYPQSQPGATGAPGTMGAPGTGAPGTMGAPGQPGTAAYPGQAGTMGNAQGSEQTGTASSRMDDKSFMKKAAEGGLAEVQLGQLAQQNGQSQQVKDFGKRMVDDHTKANDQLKQVASQKGVTLPTSPNAHDQAEYNRLSKMQGDSFDKAYSKMMVTDHKKDVSEFKREANSGSDPDVKSFASQTLPTLEDHLKMAEQMNGSEKGSKGNSSKGAGSPQQ